MSISLGLIEMATVNIVTNLGIEHVDAGSGCSGEEDEGHAALPRVPLHGRWLCVRPPASVACSTPSLLSLKGTRHAHTIACYVSFTPGLDLHGCRAFRQTLKKVWNLFDAQ